MRYVTALGAGVSEHAQSDLNAKQRTGSRTAAARRMLSRACLPVLTLEGLESRTLLSTLPAPTITSHTDVSGGGGGINQSSPSIAYDPSNPQKLVTLFTTNNPGSGTTQTVFIGGKYSINGGASWGTFAVPG